MLSRVFDGKHMLSFKSQDCMMVLCRPETISGISMAGSVAIVQSFMLNRYWVLYVNTVPACPILSMLICPDRTRRKFVTGTIGLLILVWVTILKYIQLMILVILMYQTACFYAIREHFE
jgi:hypothetical protein